MHAELAALAVHDLKNALGVLEAELDALADCPDGTAARRSSRRCADLRRRFVEYLTLYGRGQALQARPSDESPLELLEAMIRPEDRAAARDAAAGVGGGADAGTGVARLRLGACVEAPPFWFYDRRLVRMALDSALHNARRFARRTILLAARSDRGHLVFSVVDDGPGLGADDRDGQATGLGTELCRAVAGAHASAGRRGRVTLENRPQGGACFELWLP